MKNRKRERQQMLLQKMKDAPFLTDEELAGIFGVSVQTIRLDRAELGIPELRERIKSVAEKQFKDRVRALPIEEVIGEIVDLELDRRAISILDIGKQHVFSRTKIARGHHLFAQANSLAVAVIDDQQALTAKAEIRFRRQVQVGERVVAKAKVTAVEKGTTLVEVNSFVCDELVFSGKFTMFRSDRSIRKGEAK